MTDNDILIIFNSLGLSNRKVLSLIDWSGDIQSLWRRFQDGSVERCGISQQWIQKVRNFSYEEFLDNEYRLSSKSSVKIVTYLDEDYPIGLHSIVDKPIVLYVAGSMPSDDQSKLAVVGSRSASVYGLKTARTFSLFLAERGVVITSGLARGVDTAAHQGALAANGQTCAVLGSGHHHIYPKENQKLYETIKHKGCVVSEFSMTCSPRAYHFPRRNRIISALSDATLVVEASRKSGALITADFALEHGKDVMAIPGMIDSPGSYGVNDLIKQGATVITSPDDILNIFKDKMVSVKNYESTAEIMNDCDESVNLLCEQEKNVINSLGSEPVHIDSLLSNLEMTRPQVSTVLMSLEMKKILIRMPGQYYARFQPR